MHDRGDTSFLFFFISIDITKTKMNETENKEMENKEIMHQAELLKEKLYKAMDSIHDVGMHYAMNDSMHKIFKEEILLSIGLNVVAEAVERKKIRNFRGYSIDVNYKSDLIGKINEKRDFKTLYATGYDSNSSAVFIYGNEAFDNGNLFKYSDLYIRCKNFKFEEMTISTGSGFLKPKYQPKEKVKNRKKYLTDIVESLLNNVFDKQTFTYGTKATFRNLEEKIDIYSGISVSSYLDSELLLDAKSYNEILRK